MKLADLTTLRVGGEAEHILAPADSRELVDAVRQVWATGDDWLLLGGGSNVVIGDEGFDGTVVRVVTRGIERLPPAAASLRPSAYVRERTVRLRVQAGEGRLDLRVSLGAEPRGRGPDAHERVGEREGVSDGTPPSRPVTRSG